MTRPFTATIGANLRSNGTEFRVWAPDAALVEVAIEGHRSGSSPAMGSHPMRRDAEGYHSTLVSGAAAGTFYRYLIEGAGPFPDPASRAQPQGVHGPSEVVAWEEFAWTDGHWRGVPLDRTVIYELHIGAFTPEGTFASAAARLPGLAELGVTAVELMPVADFPGARNWGYDGVAPFAPARCYGTPDDLRRFVDVAHALGLAVHLDVVYNHFGPDGAYQSIYSRYYHSTSHHSPWGAGINFDGPQSDPVRAYVVENALRWVHEFHVDGLRLDATHAIADSSGTHILAELAAAVRESMAAAARVVHVIAEDSRNLDTIVRPRSSGGWALDGVWSDDFHHQLRRALAGDSDGYFVDFDGTAAAIAATARRGWFYTGGLSRYTGAPRGTDPAGIDPPRFVICLQNHDQVGNRAMGDRLHHRIDLAVWRAASVLLLVLPETPLIFMGQEWAAGTPFRYFTDHEPGLGRLVTEGRRREFARFVAFADPAVRDLIPDPQEAATFTASRLDWAEPDREPHASIRRMYRRLLELRRHWPAVTSDSAAFDVAADGADSVIVRRGRAGGPSVLALVRLRGSGPVRPDPHFVRLDEGARWHRALSTEDEPFAVDPVEPAVDDESPAVTFGRAGGVIFQSGPWPPRKEP